MTRACEFCGGDLDAVRPRLRSDARYCNATCARDASRARRSAQSTQKANDVDRVLSALKNGPVTPMDFDAPRVVDGLKPIRRVAARICDLRKEGYEITTSRLPSGVAVYRLDDRPTAGERSEGASPTEPVVTNPRPRADAADCPLPAGGALFDPDRLAA